MQFVLTSIVCVCFCISFYPSRAQVTPPGAPEPAPTIEQQLENLTEANDDATTEDDSYLQELVHFIKDPININYADAGELQELKFLSPLQINNLLSYRKLLGNFISIYELQAVPGWDVNLIKKIIAYLTVNTRVDVFNNLGNRLKNGSNTVLVRATETLEKSKGYCSRIPIQQIFMPEAHKKYWYVINIYSRIFCNMVLQQKKMPGNSSLKGRKRMDLIFILLIFL